MTSGNEVEQQTFDAANTQKWKFVYYGGGNIYTIRSAQDNSCYLGVQNNSTDDGANIVLRTGTVTSGMKWRIIQGNEGWKICAFNNSAMVLATYSSDDEPGEKLILGDWVDNTSYRDEWCITLGLDVALIALPASYDRSSYFSDIVTSLKNVGYYSFLNNHHTIATGMNKEELLSYMQSAKITLIRTHGLSTSITVSDGSLTRNDLLTLPSNALNNSKLIIYGACLTAQGGANGTNLVSATVAAGAQTVIGFQNNVYSTACNYWCEKFFEYYVEAYYDDSKDYSWVCIETDAKAQKKWKYEYINDDGDLVSLRNYVIAGNDEIN